MATRTFSKKAIRRRSVVSGMAMLSTAMLGFAAPASADGTLSIISPNLASTATPTDATTVLDATPTNSVKKVVNGKYAVQVDNGWVIYQGFAGQPTLDFYNEDTNGNFNPAPSIKLRPGTSTAIFDAGGIVFGPCPVLGGNVKCAADADGGLSGVGIGFGMATVGGPGGSAGGWITDDTMLAHLTNPNGGGGSISALAIDGTNGAYAVGWDSNNAFSSNQAIIWQLDSAGQTYAPISMTNLGTLGGTVSQALAISKNAQYVAGIANDAVGVGHAVFAPVGATSWTNISSGFPAGTLKSSAVAVSSTGYVAGTITVKHLVAGKMKSVDQGFLYNTSTSTITIFSSALGNVEPLKVLDNGNVVGNIKLFGTSTVPGYHPFVYNNATSTMTDFGTMVLSSTGLPAFGCRVNRPNTLGEIVGSCIPNGTTPYGTVGAFAFYLDTRVSSAAFVDVNASVHSTNDAAISAIKPYVMNSLSSIDDQDEATVIGTKVVNGAANEAAFIASPAAYNP